MISLHKLNIVLRTKTHLEAGIFNAELFPNQFIVYRKDRKSLNFGGGVFIVISKLIPSCYLTINLAQTLLDMLTVSLSP